MITYAGQPCLLEDPDGKLRAWFERYWDWDDLRVTGATPSACLQNRIGGRRDIDNSVGMPVVNWPEPPRLRINTLYWPSGATRWAICLLLVDGAHLDTMLGNLSYNGSATLRLDDGVTSHGDPASSAGEAPTYFEATMYPLRPMRISYAPTAAEELWLLPVVDQRYFFQFRNVGDVEVERYSIPLWTELWSYLRPYVTATGGTFTVDTVPSSYPYPDKVELSRYYENLGVFLDAVAWSVGMRVVADLDGSISLLRYSSSDTRLASNLPSSGGTSENSLVGGYGDKWLRYPATVDFIFRRHNGASISRQSGVWRKQVTLAEIDATFYSQPGTKKAFHCAAGARFETSSTVAVTSTPDNLTDLTAYAMAAAEDYYRYLPTPYDVTLPGLAEWEPTGYDDYVLWYIGHRYDDQPTDNGSEYACHTRARSLPWDVGVDELLGQLDPARTFGVFGGQTMDEDEPVWYELTEELTFGAGGRLALAHPVNRQADQATTEITAQIEDVSGQHWGLPGERILVRTWRNWATNKWVREAISSGAPWHFGVLLQDLLGTTSHPKDVDPTTVPINCRVYVFDVATDIAVIAPFLNTGQQIDAGEVIGVERDVHNSLWIATEARCVAVS